MTAMGGKLPLDCASAAAHRGGLGQVDGQAKEVKGTWVPNVGTHGPASRDMAERPAPGPRALDSCQVQRAGLIVERALVVG